MRCEGFTGGLLRSSAPPRLPVSLGLGTLRSTQPPAHRLWLYLRTNVWMCECVCVSMGGQPVRMGGRKQPFYAEGVQSRGHRWRCLAFSSG